MHITTRIKAEHYTLKLAKQILRYLLSQNEALVKTLLDLDHALNPLPPLKVMMAMRLEMLERVDEEESEQQDSKD